jgi:hypothetical protein
MMQNPSLYFTSTVTQLYIESFRRWHWIDELTRTLEFNLITYNKNGYGRITTAKLQFDFSAGGRIDSFLTIESASPMTLAEQTPALILTSIFCVCMAVRWASLIRKFRHRRVNARMAFLNFPLLLVQSGLVLAYVLTLYHANTRQMTPISVRGLQTQTIALLHDFEELAFGVTVIQRYGYVVGMSLLGLLVQMLHLMDFNRDLSIVTRTLHRAGRDLCYFFLVYWVVLFVYSVVAMFLLSGMASEFRTFYRSINQLMLISVGEFEQTRDIIFHPEQTGTHMVVSALFFWSYVFVSTLLLLNVFLSIVVDSFVGLQVSRLDADMHFRKLQLDFFVNSSLRRFALVFANTQQ